VQRLGVSSHS